MDQTYPKYSGNVNPLVARASSAELPWGATSHLGGVGKIRFFGGIHRRSIVNLAPRVGVRKTPPRGAKRV